jgi:hypothetical protein
MEDKDCDIDSSDIREEVDIGKGGSSVRGPIIQSGYLLLLSLSVLISLSCIAWMRW